MVELKPFGNDETDVTESFGLTELLNESRDSDGGFGSSPPLPITQKCLPYLLLSLFPFCPFSICQCQLMRLLCDSAGHSYTEEDR